MQNDAAAIAALVDAGAGPNVKDTGGEIPLHDAAGRSYTAAITALLGANPNVKTKDGYTRRQHTDLFRLRMSR